MIMASEYRPIRRKTSEAQIQQQIDDYLTLDDWRVLKTDLPHLRGLGVQELGMADRQYVRYSYGPGGLEECTCKMRKDCACAQLLWVEHKKRGGKAKAHQEKWHEVERARGALTLIAGVDFTASIEGFTAWYEDSGLQRKKVWIKGMSA